MTPDVFVHGDPHLGNVLVGSSHACLIDWEDAGWGDRMVDLARVATALNRTEDFSDARGVRSGTGTAGMWRCRSRRRCTMLPADLGWLTRR